LTPGGPVPLALPARSTFRAFVAGQLVFSLEEDWAKELPAGALVSLDLDASMADPAHVSPVLVYAPGPREAIEDVAATRDRLIATIYRNVQGTAVAFHHDAESWIANPLDRKSTRLNSSHVSISYA